MPSVPNFGKRKITGMISVAKLDARGFPECLGAAFQFVYGSHAESNTSSAPEQGPEADMWSPERNESTLILREVVVKHMTPGTEAEEMFRNSSSEADEACVGDAGPGRTLRGAERYREGTLIETFRRIEKASRLSQRNSTTEAN